MVLIRTDSRTHVRCRRCETRRVLPRHPDLYVRLMPVCTSPGCGSRDYRADKWMNQRNTSPHGKSARGCNCPGWWFIHRKGSRFCWYRKTGELRMPGDEDFQDRHYEVAA